MDYKQQGTPEFPPGMNMTPPNTNNGYIPANAMSVASLVLGILSIVSLCMVYFSPIFACLSILFALLSRGSQKKLHGFSIVGIVTSVFGLAISAIIWICVFVFAFQLMSDPSRVSADFWQTYKETGERLYGEEFDDMLKQIYGEDFDIDQSIEGGSLWLEQ